MQPGTSPVKYRRLCFLRSASGQMNERRKEKGGYLIAVAYWPQKVKSFISDVIRNAERNRQEYRMENELQRREKHRRSDDWER